MEAEEEGEVGAGGGGGGGGRGDPGVEREGADSRRWSAVISRTLCLMP